jgi:hypothetical protein
MAQQPVRKLDDHVLMREVLGSSVLLDLNSERYLGLDESATQMLRALQEFESFELAVDHLLGLYDDADRERIEGDLREFVADLESRGLLAGE